MLKYKKKDQLKAKKTVDGNKVSISNLLYSKLCIEATVISLEIINRYSTHIFKQRNIKSRFLFEMEFF